MKYLLSYCLALFIIILGIVSVMGYMWEDNTIWELQTWVWWFLAYFTILKPSFDVWSIRFQKLINKRNG